MILKNLKEKFRFSTSNTLKLQWLFIGNWIFKFFKNFSTPWPQWQTSDLNLFPNKMKLWIQHIWWLWWWWWSSTFVLDTHTHMTFQHFIENNRIVNNTFLLPPPTKKKSNNHLFFIVSFIKLQTNKQTHLCVCVCFSDYN